jgi:hypothetical protein
MRVDQNPPSHARCLRQRALRRAGPGVLRAAVEDPPVGPPQPGLADFRTRAQPLQGFLGRCRIVEAQRGCAVRRQDIRHADQLGLDSVAAGAHIDSELHQEVQHQTQAGRQRDGQQQLAPDGQIAEAHGA